MLPVPQYRSSSTSVGRSSAVVSGHEERVRLKRRLGCQRWADLLTTNGLQCRTGVAPPPGGQQQNDGRPAGAASPAASATKLYSTSACAVLVCRRGGSDERMGRVVRCKAVRMP